MKVYNGKLLALTVLGGGGLIAYFVYEFYSQGRWTTLLLIVWFAYLFVQGLRASLTEEGYAKDQENGRRGEDLFRKLFGRRAGFMRYLHLYAMVLGIALSAILCQVLGTGFSLSYGAIALGVGFSAAVGVLFGWSPARKASRLNPIDALRRM